MRPLGHGPQTHRRGLTLVELMVTVALMLIIMSILVAVFRSATDAMTTVQVDQELAQVTRRLDTVIRQDLQGATARFTPPLNPADNLGYFEYGEGAPADAQGEDTDDYIALTVKAPPGQPFTGRIMLPRGFTNEAIPRPIFGPPTTITSEHAEVLYFLRNGNLYRRVLLIVPERQSSIRGSFPSTTPRDAFGFIVNGQEISWQGANDVSARPSRAGSNDYTPILNTLGDLTNRENRMFRPRFADDYTTEGDLETSPPDGIPDDRNFDGVPDFYPTLYPRAFAAGLINTFDLMGNPFIPIPPALRTVETLPFPFLFPGQYSNGTNTPPFPPPPGGIHVIHNPALGPPNHSPLDIGDSLSSAGLIRQTWWGFPTWRETRSPFWTNPIKRINDPRNALYFTSPFGPGRHASDQPNRQAPGMSLANALPLTQVPDQPFTDGAGRGLAPMDPLSWEPIPNYFENQWEDDLLATNVRSLDVKAYDPNRSAINLGLRPEYVDLGYGAGLLPNYSPDTGFAFPPPDQNFIDAVRVVTQSFGLEGRMPPRPGDYRADPQWPLWNPNVGDADDNVVRMRRVWDSWSTAYTNAPSAPLKPLFGAPFRQPTYPSYPAPYPSALRGIQIQIRITDPNLRRLKVLTIRQDFTDKL
ncbi:hypothetical protein BH23PLA1_BH23PLA1_24130 [soil metagenome]